MGERDKGLVKLAGRPMIEHIIERVEPQVGAVTINANRHLETYRDYGYPVISDADDEFSGPLAGMAAALRHCNTPWLMTVPCDSPLLPLDLAARLYHALKTQRAELAVADDGERLHPVFCLLSRQLSHSLENFLAQGQRKIDLWFELIHTARADFSNQAERFGNINTPDELTRIEQTLTQP